MKRHAITALILLLFAHGGFGQTVIFDARHFAIVNENGVMREAAENRHENSLEKIKQDLDNINLNLSSVVLVQDMIHQALTTVNGTLKNGLAVQQVVGLTGDITRQSSQIINLAQGNPLLMLFAEEKAEQMKTRGINLASEVSGFILKEGNNVLMDYEKRDFLLRKIILELQVMRALSYSAYKNMYWAKVNGILRSANPFQGFINQDIRMANELMVRYQTLKK